jgi:hypothetical protein
MRSSYAAGAKWAPHRLEEQKLQLRDRHCAINRLRKLLPSFAPHHTFYIEPANPIFPLL